MQWYAVTIRELFFELSMPVCIRSISYFTTFPKWATEVCLLINFGTIARKTREDQFIRQLSLKLSLNQFWKMSGGYLWSPTTCRHILKICHHPVSSLIPVLSLLHEILVRHHISLDEGKGAWTVPLKPMVIFSLSSVGACISLQRLVKHISNRAGN